MRILQVNSFSNGSTGKIAAAIHSCLLGDGESASVCYGRGPIIDEQYYFRFDNQLSIYEDALLTRITGYMGCFSHFGTKRLIEYISQFDPDIVHLHNIHGYYVNIYKLIWYLRENGIRTIITLHDEYLYTGKCPYAYDCNKWMTGCFDCHRLHEYPAALAFDRSSAMYGAKSNLFLGWDKVFLVAPSHYFANRIKQSFLKDKYLAVINNGVDTNVFMPRDAAALVDKLGVIGLKVVLAVAPDIMDPRKGGKYVIELARKLEGRGIFFVMIGVRKKPKLLPSNVLCLKKTENQNELAVYYSMADLYILCSERETFSMTCAESLCCGTPVVGFKSGAPESIFSHPFASFVPYGDMDQLEHMVLEMIDTKSELSCSEYGKAHFSQEKMYNEYKKTYVDLIQR